MVVNKVIVENYKCLKNFELDFNADINIIVGDNEVGKSTLLEAINLVLTCQLNGRNIHSELTPYIFNDDTVKDYIASLQSGTKAPPPQISIELYLKETVETVDFKGTNNSRRKNECGIRLSIEFNEKYLEEYKKYISKPSEIRTVPIEYYDAKWFTFADHQITSRNIPINTTLIDSTIIKLQSGTDRYMAKIIDDVLSDKEKADLALSYRKLKESFAKEDAIQSINTNLSSQKGELSDKALTVSVDISPRTSWECGLTSYLNDIPFHFIGKGEQSSVKINLALNTKATDAHLVLIEEPENHLSYTNMNRLVKRISEKCSGKQLIITTHSTFVLNKLGLEKVILINKNGKNTSLSQLTKGTEKYFKKLPGYDTLRMLLSKKPILVEGPSDELIVQKAYKQKHDKLPIEDGIDIISVGSLAFKRFLEVAKILEKEVTIITDNDGDIEKLKEKYRDYSSHKYIKICYSTNMSCKTLEPQIVNINELDTLNQALNRNDATKEDIQDFMLNNKAEAALRIFETSVSMKFPEYIENAIA